VIDATKITPRLSAKRRTVEWRAKAADNIHAVARCLAGNAMTVLGDHATVTGAFVVILSDHGPQVWWAGLEDQADIRDIRRCIDAITHARPDPGESLNDHIARQWLDAWRREEERTIERRAHRRDRWICEFCDHAYDRRGDAERHERTCWRNPAASMYAEGLYEPTMVTDGRVSAYRLTRRPS
jgi:hypothetical protein